VTIARRAVPFFRDQYMRERKRPIAAAPHTPHPEFWPDTGIHAAWLGHTTVLLKIEGVTILTDPVFSSRIGVNLGPLTIGMKRLVAPALAMKDILRPDLVLLSHAHMDHFDRPSLRMLESCKTRVVTASRTSDLLRVRRYGKVDELDWNDAVQIGDLRIRAFEVRHWGARMQTDTWRGYNGYLIETPRHRVIFGGDTAETDSFRQLRSSRRADLAIMPIGAYNPWVRVHCTPEQAVRMANDAGADFILPVHHQTFQLSQEPRMEPIERLKAALAKSPERVGLQAIGQELHI
jgi:L-ascorbate metabolism protein UlaG (beta-lactamase superfamily)